MKGFLVFLLFTSAALASPQYNYLQPSGAVSNFGANIGGGFVESNHIGGSGNIGHGHGLSGGYSRGGAGGFSHDSATQHAIVTKQFLIHSAPHEEDDHGIDKVIHLGAAHKNYRVVFIKAPHQGVHQGKVRFVAPANEEKTVIYVLSKKTDLADIQADVEQAHSEPTKPEVHFIKYKTVEEALHAQKTIQAQFDALEGKSQISDEGVAPLTSVIGALGDGSVPDSGIHKGHSSGGAGGHGAEIGGNSFGGITSGAYLPPNH